MGIFDIVRDFFGGPRGNETLKQEVDHKEVEDVVEDVAVDVAAAAEVLEDGFKWPEWAKKKVSSRNRKEALAFWRAIGVAIEALEEVYVKCKEGRFRVLATKGDNQSPGFRLVDANGDQKTASLVGDFEYVERGTVDVFPEERVLGASRGAVASEVMSVVEESAEEGELVPEVLTKELDNSANEDFRIAFLKALHQRKGHVVSIDGGLFELVWVSGIKDPNPSIKVLDQEGSGRSLGLNDFGVLRYVGVLPQSQKVNIYLLTRPENWLPLAEQLRLLIRPYKDLRAVKALIMDETGLIGADVPWEMAKRWRKTLNVPLFLSLP